MQTAPVSPAPSKAVEPASAIRRPWFLSYPVATFLASVIVAFAAAPFEEQIKNGDILEACTFTLILLSGLLAVGEHRRAVL